MRKFICTKLLVVFFINSLVIPFANCGKKYYKCKHDKGRNYKQKERQFNYRDRVSKKAKKKARKWQKRVEKLSKTNRARNKNWPEIQEKARKKYLLSLGKKQRVFARKRLSGLREGRKKKNRGDGLESKSLLRKLGKLFGLRVPKKLLFFGIFLAILALSSAERVHAIAMGLDAEVPDKLNCEYIVLNDREYLSCFGWFRTKPCYEGYYLVKAYHNFWGILVTPELVYCSCVYDYFEDGKDCLSCDVLHFSSPSVGYTFSQINLDNQNTVALSTTASVTNIVMSTLLASGCLIGTIGGLCCLYKKIKKDMHLESKKELENSSTVTLEEVEEDSQKKNKDNKKYVEDSSEDTTETSTGSETELDEK
ncbi:hypothetical protein ACFLYU_00115 [Candidatus Dependentiae bacterium]